MDKQGKLNPAEINLIDIFIRSAQLIGLPKSVGAIYGLLFISPGPLTRDSIMERLNISLGSASMGLKQLRAFKAIHTVFVPGDRKDYFTAESEFRKLLAGFLKEEVFPHLEMVKERLAVIAENPDCGNPDTMEHLSTRLDKLNQWTELGETSLQGFIQLMK